MNILGISAFYHDSAATFIRDGIVLSAIEEERFTRKKHENAFPFRAIEYCLAHAGISLNDVNAIAYYEKPLLKFERIIEQFVETYPFSLVPFVRTIPEWLSQKIVVEYIIRRKLGYGGKLFFIPHHLSHAATAFYASPFRESAIATIDGAGEYQTTGLWLGNDEGIKPLVSIDFPHSLGLLYSTFTAFLGFRVNEDEYKVMGLAAYGSPKFVEAIYRIVDVKEDGSFHLNMRFFSFRERTRMWSGEFQELFGKPRLSHERISERDKNLAASIQSVLEEIYFKMLNHLYVLTGSQNLCVSGGVALNAAANGKIYTRTPFRNIHIFGPAGDNGSALGAALAAYHKTPHHQGKSPIADLRLGSRYERNEIESTLRQYPLWYEQYSDQERLLHYIAKSIAEQKIIGWFRGRMEFGPRALGARSILADPRSDSMKRKVNAIKGREQFRPFACSILQEYVSEYFVVPETQQAFPFMTFCFPVKEKKKKEIAAVVHHDKTCRIQTVNAEYGEYYHLIQHFFRLTGVPCLLNTSFNLSGEPIVEHPRQAIEDFLQTPMDLLVMEDYVVEKK